MNDSSELVISSPNPRSNVNLKQPQQKRFSFITHSLKFPLHLHNSEIILFQALLHAFPHLKKVHSSRLSIFLAFGSGKVPKLAKIHLQVIFEHLNSHTELDTHRKKPS